MNSSNAPLLQRSTTPSIWSQSQGGHNPLKIVVPVVLDFNPASLVSMMDGDVRCEMFLQAILQIFHLCWHNARYAPRLSRSSTRTADSKQTGDQALGATHRSIGDRARLR